MVVVVMRGDGGVTEVSDVHSLKVSSMNESMTE